MAMESSKQKRLLLLGGARYLLPVIKAAHDLGIYVITCDYLPDNYAHQYADEYCNVSIIDKEAVLEKARQLKIDGITSFACDPGVETAAYVAEALGLPTHPYESVAILQNKARFRAFLEENGFCVPKAKGYTDWKLAQQEADLFRWPVIVKPTDSAGSKGVTKVDRVSDLKAAAEYAIGFSKTHSFIMEEYIEKAGYSSDSDCFVVDRELVFCSFSDQRFDNNSANPYTPAAYSWPSSMPQQTQKELRAELQRLFRLLKLKTSIFNVETRLGTDGKAYIMEASPRGGGNRLAEMLRYASGTDLIENTVRAAVGLPLSGIQGDPVYQGVWAEVILHSEQDGAFQKVDIAPELMPCVKELDLWVQPGETVHTFTGANHAIGTIVLEFETEEFLRRVMDDIPHYLKVVTE